MVKPGGSSTEKDKEDILRGFDPLYQDSQEQQQQQEQEWSEFVHYRAKKTSSATPQESSISHDDIDRKLSDINQGIQEIDRWIEQYEEQEGVHAEARKLQLANARAKLEAELEQIRAQLKEEAEPFMGRQSELDQHQQQQKQQQQGYEGNPPSYEETMLDVNNTKAEQGETLRNFQGSKGKKHHELRGEKYQQFSPDSPPSHYTARPEGLQVERVQQSYPAPPQGLPPHANMIKNPSGEWVYPYNQSTQEELPEHRVSEYLSEQYIAQKPITSIEDGIQVLSGRKEGIARILSEFKGRLDEDPKGQNEDEFKKNASRFVNKVIEENLRDGKLTPIPPSPTTDQNAQEYDDGNGGRLMQTKGSDGKFNFKPNDNFSGVLRVQRIDDEGGLIPNQYDVIEYERGKPVAVVPASEGHSRVANFARIQKQAGIEVSTKQNPGIDVSALTAHVSPSDNHPSPTPRPFGKPSTGRSH